MRFISIPRIVVGGRDINHVKIKIGFLNPCNTCGVRKRFLKRRIETEKCVFSERVS